MSGPHHPPLQAVGLTFLRDRRAVLDGVTLAVAAGEVVAVVGPNGSGKSTLVHLLAGDLRPHRGQVLVDGSPLGSYRPDQLARRRAVLPQRTRLEFSFTARQVVEMGRLGRRRRPESPAAHDAAVAAAMRSTATEEVAGRSYPELSGGEQARVDLARIIAQDAPIVLLDEPTASLDVRHQEAVMAVARGLARAGRAVLCVLHDLNLAATHADRVAVLARGRLVAAGPPRPVLTGELLSTVYGHPVEVVAHPRHGRPLVLPAAGRVAAGT